MSEELKNFVLNQYDILKTKLLKTTSEGKTRNSHGEITKLLVSDLLSYILKLKKCNNFKIINEGSSDKNVRIHIKNESKSCCIGSGFDLHLYINSKFVCAIEVKTYIDGTMLLNTEARTCALKEEHKDIKCIVVTLQLTSKEDNKNTWLSYVKNNGNVDAIIPLTSHIRNSKCDIHMLLPELFEEEKLNKLKELIQGL